MAGERTAAALSGFVLGALSFQHLNTDADTVSGVASPPGHCPSGLAADQAFRLLQ